MAESPAVTPNAEHSPPSVGSLPAPEMGEYSPCASEELLAADHRAPPVSWESEGQVSEVQFASERSLTDEPLLAEGMETAAMMMQFGQSPADNSLLPPERLAGSDLWRGWTVHTSEDGRLFYHHAASGTSQWQMPRELAPVLGEWEQVHDEMGRYWRNERLGVSSWKDPRRTTTLFQAALDGNTFFLQLYAEVGGDLDVVDGKGRTALHYNCAGGATQGLVYLVQRKASLDVPDATGSTPLHWACRYGHATIVRLLLESRADPDRQNGLGDTCLHEAAALGRMEPLQWLLHARANPTLQNQEARSPSQVAARNQAEQAVQLLQRHERSRRWHGRRRQRQGIGQLVEEEEADSDVLHQTGTYHEDSGSSSENDQAEPSLALVIVRAARPVLRGVQWLANRVLGEKRTDLGQSNKYRYDDQTGQWVLRRPSLPRNRDSEGEDSGESFASESEEESPVRKKLQQLSRGLSGKLVGRRVSDGSEGISGGV